MGGISAKISRGILRALDEAAPRGLALQPLCVYAAGLSGCPITAEIALRHLLDLERRGFARRERSPLSDEEETWHVTPEGRAYA